MQQMQFDQNHATNKEFLFILCIGWGLRLSLL